ncbi:MAG: hypothetical protein J6Z08_02275 [Elusimicrobiales bacterium]|nr:hypothetical protein [Elusimicrobiales bacterium]
MKRRIYIRKTHVLFLLVMLFIIWRPCFLESEVIKMTSYYPAPYGGYEKLFAIGNTYLKKSGGVVSSNAIAASWGPNDSTGLSMNGDIWIQGTAYNSTPTIYFQPDPAKKLYNSIGLKYGTFGRSQADRILAVEGDMKIGTNTDSNMTYVYRGGQYRYVGALRQFCQVKPYTYNSSNAQDARYNERTHQYIYDRVKTTYCGSSPEDSTKYTIVFLGGALSYGGSQYVNSATSQIHYNQGQYLTLNANYWNSYHGGNLWRYIWNHLYYRTSTLTGDLPNSMKGGFPYIPRSGNMLCCKMETVKE